MQRVKCTHTKMSSYFAATPGEQHRDESVVDFPQDGGTCMLTKIDPTCVFFPSHLCAKQQKILNTLLSPSSSQLAPRTPHHTSDSSTTLITIPPHQTPLAGPRLLSGCQDGEHTTSADEDDEADADETKNAVKGTAAASLFSPNQMARHSILIQGHTNVREYENVVGSPPKRAKVRTEFMLS